MQTFVYPVLLTPDEDDGGFVVTFRDLPEAITQGDSVEEALAQARDCLEEAFANRIAMDLPIPGPAEAAQGEHSVALCTQMAGKASLYMAMREENLTKVELARRLDCDEKAVRRLLDPLHPSKLPRIENALAVVGRQLIIGFQPV